MPPARGGKPDALVILLHGYGSNGADLISLAPFWAKAAPGAAFVAPNAIAPCAQAPGGYQWFDIASLDPQGVDYGVRQAAASVDRFVSRELDRHGLDPSRLVLGGFSQGTMMALHVGLRRERPLAGILGFSGMLAAPARLKQELRSRPPVLLIHGDRDPMIPASAMFEAAEAIAAAGHGAQWHVSYGTPHAIGEDGLELGAAFLGLALKARALAPAS
jgi:phospholipase/carboxylesterase